MGGHETIDGMLPKGLWIENGMSVHTYKLSSQER